MLGIKPGNELRSGAGKASRAAASSRLHWRLLGWTGVGLAIVGWLDWLLTWFPLDFGNADWEFGSVSASYTALPLGTIGLALVMGAAAATRRRRVLVATAGGAAGVAVVLFVALMLFLFVLPMAWRGVDPQMHPVLRLAVLKTVVSGVVYVSLYVVLAVLALRSALGRST